MPFSTTVDKIIAHRFSKAKGVVLQLTPEIPGANHYFDCDWCSDYPMERERIFSQPTTLQISDIKNFNDSIMVGNDEWISCLKLFSSIFAGKYIFNVRNRKKVKRSEEGLIKVYNHHNGINDQCKNLNSEELEIELFIQQLFHFAVKQLKKNKHDVEMIKSQMFLLQKDLQSLLFRE